ncbi:hypothetical protein HGE68_02440 [Rhodobacteraceae bacterium R_SAG6]|nr:hypothetical protein [Rhodobacteraceae bacterium R_SAG6]
MRCWQVGGHPIFGKVVHDRVFDSDPINGSAPTNGEDADALLELVAHILPSLSFGELTGPGPLAWAAHPAATRAAKTRAGRVHHGQKIPALVKDAVANVAADMSVRAILCGFNVARPYVVATGLEGAPGDAAGFTTD